ncbi:ATP-binding protein [Corynebacterium mastitidis]|uniref:ATP-binding protein n=1 Tax=Corynebacterium mastitidis TaxID=161890 RepID=UPI002550484F|nr:ATP-binding protein [Corynebacterium mastitidis]MDK8450184.1 ATP-binding protein [Corynebacterium mastitidis]
MGETGNNAEGHEVPDVVRQALEAIGVGATADSQEGQLLEFKEDPAVHGERNPEAKLAEVLINECVCMANGAEGDSYIVLGVADKVPGPEAFTGTDCDEEWVIRKVLGGTRPGLRVEVTAIAWRKRRLLCIRIPRPFTLYTRTQGQGTWRNKKKCEPLTDEKRKEIRFRRENPDYTERRSSLCLEDLDRAALDYARSLYTHRVAVSGAEDHAPQADGELLRALGLLHDDGQLNMAAEILFAPLKPGRVSVQHHLSTVPGEEPRVTNISRPLILAFAEVKRLIEQAAPSDIMRVDFEDGQEVSIPAFPARAIDEVVANALVHRDWLLSSPVVIEQGPRTLLVSSPGSLPVGVETSRLLSTRSIPRNPTLIRAMRMLGLAEESSRGFDRMWASMLASGREAPEVVDTLSDVRVTLAAGDPDAGFIRGMKKIAQEWGGEVARSVRVLIVLRHLSRNPVLTLQKAEELLQVPETEARETMQWLKEQGIVEVVRPQRQEWALGERARGALMEDEAPVFVGLSLQQWVEAHLRDGRALTNRDIVSGTGATRAEVTDLLRYLRSQGLVQIDPNGPQRGPGTRWTAS